MALSSFAFVIGAIASLSFSWVFVTRLERLSERLGLSEALLGVIAALAADAPEITSSVSALSQHQPQIGAGVVIGSNLFNLAVLLGLGAVVAGYIALHRKVIVLGGVVALLIAGCCVASTTNAVPLPASLGTALVVMCGYVAMLGVRRKTLLDLPFGLGVTTWLVSAVDEEAMDLVTAARPPRGRRIDALTATGSLVVVVLASVAMERGATELGHHYHVANAIVGGIVLAAVTSLPNAVAAIHLAKVGRGAAAFSAALNSNNFNVIAGLLVPGLLVGPAAPSFSGIFTAASYLALTGVVLALALAKSGLTRRTGVVILFGYAIFVACLLIIS